MESFVNLGANKAIQGIVIERVDNRVRLSVKVWAPVIENGQQIFKSIICTVEVTQGEVDAIVNALGNGEKNGSENTGGDLTGQGASVLGNPVSISRNDEPQKPANTEDKV